MYFVDSDRPGGPAAVGSRKCQKKQDFPGNSGGDSPALYVFLYFLDLLNAKYTFLAAKRFRNFPHTSNNNQSSLFHRQDPLVQALLGEYMYIDIHVDIDIDIDVDIDTYIYRYRYI